MSKASKGPVSDKVESDQLIRAIFTTRLHNLLLWEAEPERKRPYREPTLLFPCIQFPEQRSALLSMIANCIL